MAYLILFIYLFNLITLSIRPLFKRSFSLYIIAFGARIITFVRRVFGGTFFAGNHETSRNILFEKKCGNWGGIFEHLGFGGGLEFMLKSYLGRNLIDTVRVRAYAHSRTYMYAHPDAPSKLVQSS